MENDWTNFPQDEYCDIYNPDNELIVHTNNEVAFNWICFQIAKESLSGYYILFNGQRYDINKYGETINRPDDLFCVNEQILTDTAICNASKDNYIPENICVGSCELYDDVEYEQIIRPNGKIIN